MKAIYKNFDGLDVSFQGALPESVYRQLAAAKQQAIKERREVLVKLGKNEVPVFVAESGMKGGFAYRFDTGLDGEIWAVRDNTSREDWNIYVSCKSLALALHGYEGAKDNILNRLMLLEAEGIKETITNDGEVIKLPHGHISRIDYCIDFETDDFELNQNSLIAHGKTKKKIIYPQDVILAGRKPIYVAIGKMPNRQVVIYDKIREIIEKKKNHFWKIWGIDKENYEKQIWRVEIRAGKKELKKWNLRSFDDFEEKIGDVIQDILMNIRYVIPNNNKNQTRWPMASFWNDAIKLSKNDLKNYISNAKREQIIIDTRKNRLEIYKKQILGMLPSLSVIEGVEEVALIPRVLEGIERDLIEQTQTNKKLMAKKIKKAKEKFIFLDDK